MLGGITYKDMNEALRAMPSKSWVGPLSGVLEAEIQPPRTDEDKDLIDQRRSRSWKAGTSV